MQGNLLTNKPNELYGKQKSGGCCGNCSEKKSCSENKNGKKNLELQAIKQSLED